MNWRTLNLIDNHRRLHLQNSEDDSAAVTFWGKRDLRPLLRQALALLDEHYGENVT